MKQLMAILIVVLCGCGQLPSGQHEPWEDASYEAVEQAWAESGLPEPAENCRLDLFKVYTPDEKGYWKSCGNPKLSYGCTDLFSYGRPAHSKTLVPHIFVAPWYYSEPYLIVHELLHTFSMCSTGARGHNDPRVWEAAGGLESVQSRAHEILKQGGWLD